MKIDPPIHLVQRDGIVDYYPEFIPTEAANFLYQHLKNHIHWEQRSVKIFGKEILQPRLTYFTGSSELEYRYSGIRLKAHLWEQEIGQLADKISNLTELPFNNVLMNYYRDGQDSMGWHADNEKELGLEPAIASLTLGQKRKFQLKHHNGELINLYPEAGSLLIMKGCLQSHWKHAIPKNSNVNQKRGRINLTFRYIDS